MELVKITFECNNFHLNFESDKSFRDILIPIELKYAQEIFNIIPEIFSTAAKMELNKKELNEK